MRLWIVTTLLARLGDEQITGGLVAADSAEEAEEAVCDMLAAKGEHIVARGSADVTDDARRLLAMVDAHG